MSFKKSLLISLILFSTIPLLILSLISISTSVHSITTSRKESLSNLSYTNGSSLEEYIETQKREIELMATNSGVIEFLDFAVSYPLEDMSDEYLFYESTLFLDEWVNSAGVYLDAVLVKVNGDIIASSNPDIVGNNIVDESYFIESLMNYDGTFIGNVTDSTLYSGNKVVTMSHIVQTGESDLAGVLILFVSIDFFSEFTNNIKLEDTGFAYIIDSSNSIIVHSSKDEYIEQITESVNNIKNNYNQSNLYITDDNSIISCYYLKNLNWFFVVKQDYNEILSSANMIYLFSGIALFVSLLISIIAGLLLTRSFTKPIMQLKSAFNSAAENKLYLPCHIQTKNEFGHLSESYNAMISELDKNYKDLEGAYQIITQTEEELKQNYELLQDEKNKNEYLAYHDVTTGLMNRIAFENRLNSVINDSLEGAVLFIDIDNFKYINDVFGHNRGDWLLKEFSNRLNNAYFDWHSVARIGGDEFLTLCVGSNAEIKNTVQKLLLLFETPFNIENNIIYITASIGIYILAPDSENVNIAIKNADIAMYKAKENGKNTYMFYHPDMNNNLIRYNQIIDILRNCIDKHEIFLLYQPEVSVTTNSILALETLMRIENKDLGLISPVEFIPIAESSGLILQLGNWALKEACTLGKKMVDDGINFGVLSVNVSSVQLMQKDFVANVLNILQSTGLDAGHLLLEITESLLINSIETNIEKLAQLRKMGISVALDDFGTGFSSLNYLANLPIDYVKIDKSFIDDICNDARKQTICNAIINMAHNLNLKVIAEGIEYEDQCDLLKGMDCDLYQGYYFSKPITEVTLMNLLQNN